MVGFLSRRIMESVTQTVERYHSETREETLGAGETGVEQIRVCSPILMRCRICLSLFSEVAIRCDRDHCPVPSRRVFDRPERWKSSNDACTPQPRVESGSRSHAPGPVRDDGLFLQGGLYRFGCQAWKPQRLDMDEVSTSFSAIPVL
jgi:hypothetical protein